MKTRYQIVILVGIVLAVFYPALFADFNTIDDRDLIASLSQTQNWSIIDLFVPHMGGGLYYRPVLYLTYFLDSHLWFLDRGMMHFDNVLLHILNTCLVYAISRFLLRQTNQEKSLLPLFIALLFGLHPVNTESVNWISGRTDLLACTFVLGSTYFLLAYRQTKKIVYILASFVLLLLAVFSKEVALAFIPGAMLILMSSEETTCCNETVRTRDRVLLFFPLLLLAATSLVFLVTRFHAFTSDSTRVGLTIKIFFNDLDHSILVCLGAIGFYFKKILLPFPLNFAIVEVDPLYELVGVVVMLAFVLSLFTNKLKNAIFASALFLLIPALPIAFGQIAWTPYAERYAYIASAFFALSLIYYISNLKLYLTPRLLLISGVIFTFSVSVGTFNRNLTWMTNLSLFKDTTQKSPTFGKVWNEYGVALYRGGDSGGAKKAFTVSSNLSKLNSGIEYEDMSDSNLAVLAYKDGHETEAIEMFQSILKKSRGKSNKAYDNLISIYENKLRGGCGMADKAILMSYYQQYYQITHDPAIAYKMGKLAYRMDKKTEALHYYTVAYKLFPENNEYKDFAKRSMESIKREFK